jgi:iron(III) transport system ATP-binding protein
MLSVSNLAKAYTAGSESAPAVKSFSLEVPAGSLASIVGPSGCGKTTTLRCIAGLERPDSGRIVIDGQIVLDTEREIFVPAHRRPISMVFQSYAIWPHMTVRENVAYPLKVATPRISKAEIADRVSNVLSLLRIQELIDRPSTDLSGGQQQRVALARALIRRPKLLLLDEPLSNLDAKLRDEMRFELRAVLLEMKVTTVYVTHHLDEAFVLSEQINVMDRGLLIQSDKVQDLYDNPRSPFVAEFIGRGNIFRASVSGSNATGDALFDLGFTKVVCPLPAGLPPVRDVLLMVRPEGIYFRSNLDAGAEDKGVFSGRIVSSAFLGEKNEYRVRIDSLDQELRVVSPGRAELLPETTQVKLGIRADACVVIPSPDQN